MHCSEPPSMQAVRQKDSMSAFLSLCSASWSTKELRKHQTESLSIQSCSFWLIVRSSSHPVWSQGDKKVLKSSKFGFTAKLGWPSKVGVIQGSKFWTLTVLLVKRLVKKGHERTWRCSLCIEKSDKKRSYALHWCSSHFALTPPSCPINSYDRALL